MNDNGTLTDLRSIYLTIPEVAEVLRKRPKTIYRYLRLGMPARKIGQTYLVRRDELVAWIDSSSTFRRPPFRRQRKAAASRP